MTDNEIIKAFKCCCIEDPRPNCKECPIEGTCANCNLDYEVFSLINRQKAEIERLKVDLQSMRNAANSYKMHYETAKSEAIKEFAEILKEKYGTASCIVIINNNDIDDLVQEMMEVEK